MHLSLVLFVLSLLLKKPIGQCLLVALTAFAGWNNVQSQMSDETLRVPREAMRKYEGCLKLVYDQVRVLPANSKAGILLAEAAIKSKKQEEGLSKAELEAEIQKIRERYQAQFSKPQVNRYRIELYFSPDKGFYAKSVRQDGLVAEFYYDGDRFYRIREKYRHAELIVNHRFAISAYTPFLLGLYLDPAALSTFAEKAAGEEFQWNLGSNKSFTATRGNTISAMVPSLLEVSRDASDLSGVYADEFRLINAERIACSQMPETSYILRRGFNLRTNGTSIPLDIRSDELY